MRAVFGVVSLWVVLAVVGLIASRQLQSAKLASVPAASSASSGAPAPAEPAANVREQSQRFQEQVRSDVQKSLEQGARKDVDQ